MTGVPEGTFPADGAIERSAGEAGTLDWALARGPMVNAKARKANATAQRITSILLTTPPSQIERSSNAGLVALLEKRLVMLPDAPKPFKFVPLKRQTSAV